MAYKYIHQVQFTREPPVQFVHLKPNSRHIYI